jgi:magnesium-protoporphyrin O-methyltransferase
VSCCQPTAADQQFDARIAQKDLQRFRRRGPDKSTRHIIGALGRAALPAGPSVLDVGGGVGAIHHVLLDQGFANAQHVDASSAYLAAAAAESARRGHAARVQFVHGEFAVVADRIPAADVVTLDRVVCCDPDYARLLTAAAAHARRALAFSYPRPRLLARWIIALANGLRRLMRQPFRVYLHSPTGMGAVLERQGLRRRWSGGTWIWAVELFERAA